MEKEKKGDFSLCRHKVVLRIACNHQKQGENEHEQLLQRSKIAFMGLISRVDHFYSLLYLKYIKKCSLLLYLFQA